jgi:hypothetical protein
MPAHRKRRKPLATEVGSDGSDDEDLVERLHTAHERRIKPAGVSAERLLQGAVLDAGRGGTDARGGVPVEFART